MAKTSAKKRISSFFEPVINFFTGFHKRFVDGSIGTKLSHFICGAGNFYHKQYIKGALYLILQIVFALFMITSPKVGGEHFGIKGLAGLALKGQDVDYGQGILKSESYLMLLFGVVTVGVIFVYLFVWISNIKSSYLADKCVEQGKHPSTFVEDCKSLLDDRFHVLMLTPTLLAALVFTILPTIYMILIAFTTYNQTDMMYVDPETGDEVMSNLFHWNGIDNFVAMFTGESTVGQEISARFLPVLGWTFIWAIFATFTCYFGGIILAILINKKGVKGKKIFRTCFILTIALPTFISLLSVRQLLSTGGPINKLLVETLQVIDKPINFFQLGKLDEATYNPTIAKVMVIIVNMWVGIPYTMLMTSGILMNIPTDLYEAATVDGAGKMKMFFKITMPYIIFVTTPYLISSFIGNINSFNIIYLLTGGGPGIQYFDGTPNPTYYAGQTDLLVTWLFKLTIENGQYNTGAVISILTFIITASITLVTYRNSKAYKEEDTFQ